MSCTCQTCKCTAANNMVSCQLCMKDLYCSEECKQLGWSVHQDDCNVWDAPEANVTVFLDKNDKTNHIMRYVNPSGFIEQHVVIGNSSSSSSPSEPAAAEEKNYSMQFELNGEEIYTVQNIELSENSIYSSALGMAGKIAKSKEFTAQNPIVLWPGKLNIDMAGEEAGLIQIKIRDSDSGKLISSIAGIYDLGIASSIPNLPAKNIRNAQVLKARDANENYCELTFVDQKLVDVEYHLSSLDPLVNNAATAKFDSERTEFICDPNDIDHVNGLVMAMEDLGGAAKFHQFDTINQYREALEAGTIDGPSPKINGAIQMAQRELWELVSARPNFFTRLRDRGTKAKLSNQRIKKEELAIRRKKLTQAQFDTKFRELLDELTLSRQQNLVNSTALTILIFMVSNANNLGYKLDTNMKLEFDKLRRTETLTKKEKREGEKQMESYE